MIKSTITAVLLSSVALVPATTVALVVTADAVEAKSNNGGGNGGGGGNKGGNSAKSKSDNKSASRGGSGGGNSKARGSGKDPIGNFLRKVTGQEKKQEKAKTRTTTTKAKRAPSTTKVAKATPAKDAMHPSNLGKMNGALNANVNALIAHVKNGNTNGPIGGMAALAVAGYAAEGAAETLELDGKFAALDTALIENGYVDADGNADLEGYLAAVEGVPANGEIDAIEDALTNIDSPLSVEEALLAENNGTQDFASVEEYEAWRDGVAGADPIDGADEMIAELDGLERPSEEDLADAGARLEDQTAAEDYMLSIWNKGDNDATVRSEEEENLLAKLYERIEADGDELTSAIEEYADLPEEPVEEEDVTSCESDESCDEVIEEDIVLIVE